MTEFKYRDTLEGWVEGIFDTLGTYLYTLLSFTFRPLRTLETLIKTPDRVVEFSSPAVFLIVSYLVMCILIVPVDFSDKMFSLNIARVLDAVGVLDAAKTIKAEALLVKIIPAVLSLFLFVSISRVTLWLGKDELDPRVLRRDYSYFLGGCFIVIGVLCAGYEYLVKPVAVHFWWIGLVIHTLTFLPFAGAMIPLFAIVSHGTPASSRAVAMRWFAAILPVLALMGLLRLTSGSFYLMDYLRTRP